MQERFNWYCLTKKIASKPSGSVYLAHRINHVSQKVALKIFNAASFTSEQQGQNFLQKVERIRQLKHSSIVPILDLGIEQGYPFVVMEYFTSSSLRHRLDGLSPQRLDLQEVLSIIFQIGQALCYAHAHYILHGNLKPENIFFNGNDEVLLSDFGLASFIDLTKLFHKSDLQMLNYLAPEQFVGFTTEKSDQYALACLAYELITGQMPFSAQNFPLIERDESGDIDQAVQAQVPSFCENTQCPDYGKVGRDNLRKFGKTRRGTQRWQCKTCQATLTSSPMSAKCHTKLPVSLSDLVPDLPRPIEAVVLKAMAQDPSERYTDISIFLRTLQVALLSPTPAFTDYLIASPVTPLPTSLMMSFEKIQSAHLTTPLPESWKHIQMDSHASNVLATSNPDTYHPNKPTALPNSERLFEKVASAVPDEPTEPESLLTEKSAKSKGKQKESGTSTFQTASDTYHPSKPVTKPKLDAYRANKDLIETLPEGKGPHPSHPLPPILWLAFALSGIALLLGTVALYALVPSHSPESSKPVKSSSTAQPSSPTPTLTPAKSYEAEDPQNMLAGGARVIDCSGGVCSGGARVGYIGLNAGEAGTLQFNNVSKNVAGKYTLTIYYIIIGHDQLTMDISVNARTAITLNVPDTANGDTVGAASITVNLNAGNNTIEFSNPSVPAPDIDRIVV